MIDLGFDSSVGINNSGQVAGNSWFGAVLWDNGVMTDLRTLGASHSYPFAINNRRQVIGNSLTASDMENRGVVWCIDEERPLFIDAVTASPNLLWPPNTLMVLGTVKRGTNLVMASSL